MSAVMMLYRKGLGLTIEIARNEQSKARSGMEDAFRKEYLLQTLTI